MTRTTRTSERAGIVSQISSFRARRAQVSPSGSAVAGPSGNRGGGSPRGHGPPGDSTMFGDDLPPAPIPPANPGGDGGGDPDPDPGDGDGDDPDPNPAGGHGNNPDDGDNDDDNAPNLAEAITYLADKLDKPSESKTKSRDPDTFDGSDPRKLRTFLTQCELSFRDRPKAFNTDAAKVTFAITYLKDSAFDWFEPFITDGSHPDWETDYSEFVRELRENFGPFDPIGDAENELNSLTMAENQRYAKFALKFNRLASLVQWDEKALSFAFYRALPPRIKDEMSRVGRPMTLRPLKELARSLDARYWRRQEEIKQENRAKSSSSRDNQSKSTKPAPTTSSSTSKSTSTSSRPSGSNTSTSTSTPKKPAEDLTGKLGKDGKLTKEERQRRFDNNLCLFCGSTGHKVSDCRKATKARSAKITEVSESSKK
jgi:hypothetical protein